MEMERNRERTMYVYYALNWIYRIAGKFGENEKNGYELILAKFKFGDRALAKAMMSSLLYYIMREI